VAIKPLLCDYSIQLQQVDVQGSHAMTHLAQWLVQLWLQPSLTVVKKMQLTDSCKK